MVPRFTLWSTPEDYFASVVVESKPVNYLEKSAISFRGHAHGITDYMQKDAQTVFVHDTWISRRNGMTRTGFSGGRVWRRRPPGPRPTPRSALYQTTDDNGTNSVHLRVARFHGRRPFSAIDRCRFRDHTDSVPILKS